MRNQSAQLILFMSLLIGQAEAETSIAAPLHLAPLELTDLDGTTLAKMDLDGRFTNASGEKVAEFGLIHREGFSYLRYGGNWPYWPFFPYEDTFPRRPVRKAEFEENELPPAWLVLDSGKPALQQEGDRYVFPNASRPVFEVQLDGLITLNGKPWGRVKGYRQSEEQRERFGAMLVVSLIPIVTWRGWPEPPPRWNADLMPLPTHIPPPPPPPPPGPGDED